MEIGSDDKRGTSIYVKLTVGYYVLLGVSLMGSYASGLNDVDSGEGVAGAVSSAYLIAWMTVFVPLFIGAIVEERSGRRVIAWSYLLFLVMPLILLWRIGISNNPRGDDGFLGLLALILIVLGLAATFLGIGVRRIAGRTKSPN